MSEVTSVTKGGGFDMDTPVSKITDSELKVMRVLWAAKEALPMAAIRETLEKFF